MTNLDRLPSLSLRLSLSLAVVFAAILSILSFSVYAMIAEHLNTRQNQAIERLAGLVEHLASESSTSLEIDDFDHALEDFMVGHDELAIEFTRSSGPVRFGRWREFQDRLAANEKYFRSFEFDLVVPSMRQHETVVAHMIHDGTTDASLLSTLRVILGLTSVLCAIAGSGIVAWQVKARLQPLSTLAHQIRKVDASNLSIRLPGVEPSREITPLVERFNELLSRLELAYNQLESFNADVAHELKTPLATMSSATELALLRPDADCAHLRELLTSNLEEIERMDNVIRSMLLIATAERGAHAERQRIDSLARIVESVADYHEAALEERDLSVKITGDGSLFGDPMLVRQAISNLLSNATRHADSGTTVLVSIESSGDTEDEKVSGESARKALLLTVTNQGRPIAPHHINRLFERFYRVDEPLSSDSVDRSATRHGLGLSIVAAVARMHGGQVDAISNDGSNSFFISFDVNT